MSPNGDIGEPSRQRTQSRKKLKREQAQCYRDNKALKLQVEKDQKRADIHKSVG